MRSLLAVLLFILTLSTTSPGAEGAEKAATKAANYWLSLIDGGVMRPVGMSPHQCLRVQCRRLNGRRCWRTPVRLSGRSSPEALSPRFTPPACPVHRTASTWSFATKLRLSIRNRPLKQSRRRWAMMGSGEYPGISSGRLAIMLSRL